MNIPTTVRVYIDGDGPGFYAAVCDDCVEAPLGVEGCGATRYYKRDAKADLNFHLEAHLAWAKGERHLGWPSTR